jgi:uncharacterized membrane protein
MNLQSRFKMATVSGLQRSRAMSQVSPNPHATAKIGSHPIHPMLIYFPIAAFVFTLVADIALLNTNNEFWFFAGRWLLIAGLITALLAAVAGLIDFLGSDQIRSITAAWVHAGGNVTIVLLESVNLYLRYGSSGTTVTSMEVALSAVCVVLLLVTGWLGGELVYRHRVAVRD